VSTRKDETRRRILGVARKLLVERGYYGVGLEEVAAAAGVSRQAIYQHHFRSKGELLLALVEHVDDVEGVRELVAPALAAPTAIDALAAMVAGVATIDERIHDIASVLAAARVADKAAEAAWQDRMQRRLAGAKFMIRRLQEEGLLDAAWNASDAADYLFTALSLATYQSLVVERRWPKKRYIERMRRVLHAALVTPTPARTAGRGVSKSELEVHGRPRMRR
jgi:AcrR family transcriptional regulator